MTKYIYDDLKVEIKKLELSLMLLEMSSHNFNKKAYIEDFKISTVNIIDLIDELNNRLNKGE